MVATAGLEPATPSLWVMCSNQLSYVAIILTPFQSGAYYADQPFCRQPLFVLNEVIA